MTVAFSGSVVDPAAESSVWRAVVFSLGLHGVLVGLLLIWHPVAVSTPPRPVVTFEMVAPPPVVAPEVARPSPPPPVVEEQPPPPPPPVEVEKPQPEARKPEPEPVAPKPVVKPVKVVKKPPVQPKPARPAPVVNTPPVAAPVVEEPALPVETTKAVAAPVAPVEEPYRPPDVRAAYASNPRPAYPPSARRMGYEGTVLLTVHVSVSGTVTGVEIGRGSGFDSLDQAAREAVLRWRFTPAQQGGRAVAATVTVPIRFQLESN